jgi:hypothetical protein
MSNQAPERQKKKEKDEREWTTPEQKTFLSSEQATYALQRGKGTVKAFFNRIMPAFFEEFPTQPITLAERLKHGPDWSMGDKTRQEQEVSI